jgi:hypothetical protein
LKDQSNELEHNNKSLEVAFNFVESRLSDDLIMKRVEPESNNNDEKGWEKLKFSFLIYVFYNFRIYF